MKKRILSLFLALLVVTSLLAGCAQQAQSAAAPAAEAIEAPAAPAVTEAPTATEAPAEEAKPTTQTFTDMGGNEVTLPAEIHSIVDTWSAATDNLFNLGAADLLVSAHAAAVSDVSLLVYPKLAELQNYAKATAEELLVLNPDMVIVSNNDKYEELHNAGVNAVNLCYMTYADFKKSTLLTGQILGGDYEARAEKLAAYVDWVSETLATDLKDVADADKPIVHYIMTSDVSNLYASCGAGSIMDEWITLAGGKLATKDLGKGMGLKDVTAEQILATNPDVIMIDGDNAAEVRDALLSSKEWAGVTAIQNNAVYCIPKGCFWWGRLCGDTPLQALWAASILYPDRVTFNVHDETKKYYSKFKQCELTDAQVDGILRTDLLP